ncbi:peptidoglycan-binding domain-containing protein [Nannocystis bainbridge]|uniref:Peptidoglycan-binding domain-containing protein n=1 Tax=Nannocystis bainbridge TaxID=2995303 RepID=A0ABT5E1I1_9BACT|nr:peptidoglycan-binding domain-containing protein [Nannocystis bainbridge]MDC0719184.1 peptidoglycan-binding domain-containing protein [Nannocystis bainbridge]
MPKQRKVEPGDCLSSIAYEHGFFSATVWNAGANAGLRSARREPNLLVPGDVVVIPDRRDKGVGCPTDQRTLFRRRGVPARLNLGFVEDEEPCADTPYVLLVDGARFEGVTDGEGRLSVPISPAARQARVILGVGPEAVEYTFNLGRLLPPDQDDGVRARLENFGHSCGGETGPLGPQTAAALRNFQVEQGLAPSGIVDDETRARLSAHHGS